MQRPARGFLMVVSVLNGVLGLGSAVLPLVAPDGRLMGMDVLLPVIGEFPLASVFFRDFWWIGLVMLLALALPNLVAAIMLFRRYRWQYRATLVAGALLILWCGFEIVYMFNIAALGFLVVGVLSVLASASLMRSADAGSAGHDAECLDGGRWR